jgi:hypothetical protein
MEEQEEKKQEQQKFDNWLNKEAEELKTSKDIERKPSLQFEENKMVTFEVDFTNPFEKWEDIKNNCTKAIIPVFHNGESKNLWLNVKNPLYREIVKGGLNGQVKFRVLQSGNQASTKYNIVKE